MTMNVQKVSIERRQLNVANYNRNYHIYSGIQTVSDKKGAEISQNFVKVLYEIYKEKVNS